MKYEITQKDVKSLYDTVVKVGYCKLQHVLNIMEPDFYTTRREGWASDVYILRDPKGEYDDIAISTGYQPFGNIELPYEKCEMFDNAGREVERIEDFSPEKKIEQKKLLLHDLMTEIEMIQEHEQESSSKPKKAKEDDFEL